MKVLITGHAGMVGSHLIKQIDDLEVICPHKYQMNVANEKQVNSLASLEPNFIVHLASETDHEYCEGNPAQCYFVNAIGTGNVVNLAKRLNIPIIYASTGSVFDGESETPYSVNDKPNPLNHYNRSKYYGELIARDYEKHYILRAGWMFGGGREIDKKFVHKIIQKIDLGHKDIFVCNDTYGSPTYARDFSNIIINIINTHYPYGTYHVVNSGGLVTRFTFAEEIVNCYYKRASIIPCSSDDIRDEFPVCRTRFEALKPSVSMPNWKTSLKEYIDAYFTN